MLLQDESNGFGADALDYFALHDAFANQLQGPTVETLGRLAADGGYDMAFDAVIELHRSAGARVIMQCLIQTTLGVVVFDVADRSDTDLQKVGDFGKSQSFASQIESICSINLAGALARLNDPQNASSVSFSQNSATTLSSGTHSTSKNCRNLFGEPLVPPDRYPPQTCPAKSRRWSGACLRCYR